MSSTLPFYLEITYLSQVKLQANGRAKNLGSGFKIRFITMSTAPSISTGFLSSANN